MIKLVTITPDAEKLIAYMARVSSSHQDNPEYEKLIRYLIDHAHWSPFEMCHAVIELNTSRAIAQQILRHRSFSFQEFSQRYSSDIPGDPEFSWGREQADKNRQSSVVEFDDDTQIEWEAIQRRAFNAANNAYQQALDLGVAREQARMLLPLATPTRLYMSGSIRSWIHYIQLRTQADTQLEHREVAEECQLILAKELPTIGKILGWSAG